MTCQNNLKQIGLAFHNYESAFRSLPWGAKGGWGPSWTTDLLGFLEQTALAEIVPYGEPGGATGNDLASQRYRQLARTPLATFRCPTQYGPETFGESIDKITGRALNSYLGNGGGDVTSDDYSGSGKLGLEAGNGLLLATDFCHIDPEIPTGTCDNRPQRRPLKFSDVLDGLSNTVLVGETRYIEFDECEICDHFMLYHPDFDTGITIEFANGTDFSEALGSLHWGFNLVGAPRDQLEISLGSYHTGGLNLLMADGSIHFVTNSMDQEVRHAIASRKDGEVLQAGIFE